MDNVIEVKDLYFEYAGNEESKPVKVLKGINADIRRGEFVAVLGRNGSGKSTFAKLLNAILLPTSGKVFVNSIDTSDEKRITDIRKMAGMVFQNPDNQIVANIIEEDVAFAPENLGVPRDEIRRRVDDALAAVNMSDFAKHAPNMLSGGQKQRVAIAGVLAMEPEIIILDEPTAMLDPIGRREIMETVKKLNNEKNITVVLITHYMEEAAEAHRIILLNDGEISSVGTPREIFSDSKSLSALGLDVPQSSELAQRLNEKGFDIPSDTLGVSECATRIYDLWKRVDKL